MVELLALKDELIQVCTKMSVKLIILIKKYLIQALLVIKSNHMSLRKSFLKACLCQHSKLLFLGTCQKLAAWGRKL